MEGWQEVDKYFILYAGTAGMLLLCAGMLLFFRAYSRRLLAQQEEKNKMELEYKDQLLFANIEATEKERARIARDLHDEVGASLSLLRMQVTNADAKPVIDATIDNVRRISYDLLPPMLEAFGLSAALHAFLEKTKQGSGIEIHFDTIAEDQRFSALIELSGYRVVQELVHNTVKHSGADVIDISIVQHDGILNISYHDNGKGYDHAQLRKENGLGLKNIELRIQQCCGTVQYHTNNDGSVTLQASVPIKTQAS